MFPRVAVAVYALLLRAFEKDHRERYGDEMLELFSRRLSSAGGVWQRASFTLRAFTDTVLVGAAQRWGGRRRGGSVRGWFAGLGRDFCYAARSLSKSKLYSFVSVVSLAVGLGITFALVLLFRQTIYPPFEVRTDGLVEVLATSPSGLDERWSFPDFEELSRGSELLEVSGWAIGDGALRASDSEGADRVSVMYVTSNYFDVLGVDAVRGRGLAHGDGQAVEALPAVVRYTTWQNRFGGDEDIIGRVLMVNRTPHVVVGIAPQTFTRHRAGPRVDVWVPLAAHPFLRPDAPERHDRATEWIRILARTTGDASIESAEASVRSVMVGISSSFAEVNPDRTARVLPYGWQGARAKGYSGIIGAMFSAICILVLLVVSLNLTGMGFVRSASRERELAVRLALGSSRASLVRYLMAECVLLAVAGGMLVIAVFWASLEALSWRFGTPLPVSMRVDLPMIGLCLCAALAMTLLFGLIPALRYSAPGLAVSLKDGGGTAGRRSSRVHRIAATLQVGLTMPVLIVAGGVARGAASMTVADFGVNAEHLLVATPVDLVADGYGLQETQAFARSLHSEVSTLAGVDAVAISDGSPLDGERRTLRVKTADGEMTVETRVTRVGAGYLGVLEVPLFRGRGITSADRAGTEPVAVLTQSLVDQLFPETDPLGQRISIVSQGNSPAVEEADRSLTVVGVTDEVAGPFLESSTVNLFVSYWQNPVTSVATIVRATGPNEELVAAIQGAAVALDPDIGKPTVETFDQLVVARGADMPAWSVMFAVVAVLLSVLSGVGIFGVVAYSVANRRREIGVRMSLGSTRAHVMRTVLGSALRLAAPGLLLGGALGLFVGHRILNQMYVSIGLPMADVRVFAAASILALAVVALASAAPARNAASVDPVEALRAD